MSSQSRERLFEMSRSKGNMPDYRSVPYSKSRGELDSRKKAFSAREDLDPEKHRYLKPARKSLEERRDYPERREALPMKRVREDYPPMKESFLRNERERDDSFDSRSRDSYSSRGGGRDSFSARGTRGSFMSSRGGGRGSYGSSRGGRDSYPIRESVKSVRESYPTRGTYGYPRGSRDSFSSRGSFSSGRGGADSYSSRGRESFSTRGRGREAYPSARGRDSYSMRGREPYSTRGRESYSTRGREPYSTRGGRESYSSRGRESSRGSMRGSSRGAFRGMKRGSKYDDFSSSATSRSYEMSKKLDSSAHEDASSRNHYSEERMYRMKREAPDFHDRDSARPFKEPTSSRPFNHNSSSSSYSHGEKLIKRDRASSSHFDKERLYYSEPKMRSRNKFEETSGKRVHDDDDERNEPHREGPPHKQQRLLKREKYRDGENEVVEHGRRSRPYSEDDSGSRERRDSHDSRDHDKGRVQDRLKREDISSKGSSEEDEKRKKRVKNSKGKSDSTAKKDDDDDEEQEEEEVKIKKEDMEEDEEEEEESFDKRRKERSPSGMQVTIRSDGERAVNSEGFVKSRISGKVFVELQCPHCPGHRSITFKEYRYHLDSRGHRYKFDKLKFKHSVVLRRIRLQQRKELKEIEDKWEKDNAEEFKSTVSRYCSTCKLAYKCLPEDNCSKGIKEHDESKLHKIQLRYLNPHCEMCRMGFPSRMIYEYHIASIRHLRIRTMSQENGREGSFETESKDEASKEELDLTNFITMDSVGEDEELGTEQEELEEITGKKEDIEKAKEDAKEGEEEEEEDATEGHSRLEEEHFGMDVEEELDHEIDNPEDEEEEPEIFGKDYLIPMEALYCKLCQKAIRLDTPLGDAIIDRHCATAAHVENFNYVNSEEFMEAEHEEHVDGGEEEEEEHVERRAVVEEELEEKDNGQLDYEEEEREEKDEEQEEEERINFEEVMEEHGDDIDLDEAQEREPGKEEVAFDDDSKENGK